MRSLTILAALSLSATLLSAQQAPVTTTEPSPPLVLLPPAPAVMPDTRLHAAPANAAPAPSSELAHTLRASGRRYSVAGGIGGLVLGAAAGGALGCLANKDGYGVFCGGQDDAKVVLGAAVGAAAGAVLGAVLFRHD
jgi:hypothetical protein